MKSLEPPIDMVMWCVNCGAEMAWRKPYFVCENFECADPEWHEYDR